MKIEMSRKYMEDEGAINFDLVVAQARAPFWCKVNGRVVKVIAVSWQICNRVELILTTGEKITSIVSHILPASAREIDNEKLEGKY